MGMLLRYHRRPDRKDGAVVVAETPAAEPKPKPKRKRRRKPKPEPVDTPAPSPAQDDTGIPPEAPTEAPEAHTEG